MNTFVIPEYLYLKSPEDCIVTSDSGLRFYKHPLYNVMHIGASEEQHKAMGMKTPAEVVAFKYEALKKAFAEKNLAVYVWLHERPWRTQALLDARVWAKRKPWMTVAGDVWIDAEDPPENIWRSEVFNQVDVASTMRAKDLKILKALPARIRVYRGECSKARSENGLSWTTELEVAKFFAKRFARQHRKNAWVATAVIDKRDVVAHFTGRGEGELILLDRPYGATSQMIESIKEVA
jgi:hypothetical protein